VPGSDSEGVDRVVAQAVHALHSIVGCQIKRARRSVVMGEVGEVCHSGSSGMWSFAKTAIDNVSDDAKFSFK
jgi:hypothetical protein